MELYLDEVEIVGGVGHISCSESLSEAGLVPPWRRRIGKRSRRGLLIALSVSAYTSYATNIALHAGRFKVKVIVEVHHGILTLVVNLFTLEVKQDKVMLIELMLINCHCMYCIYTYIN